MVAAYYSFAIVMSSHNSAVGSRRGGGRTALPRWPPALAKWRAIREGRFDHRPYVPITSSLS